ncbi:hypothetical protein [Serratia liquefaciens]|uniref:hypothetical protein n=1 Tax=Serratia liquefaciens TaxID=614 RepID=UPI001F5DFAC0|nr:hypothetical protein [Serratia liquefaciens]
MKELGILHNKIGQLLVNADPDNAQKIVARAQLSLEGDVCDYEFDYIDDKGDEDWFIPDKLAGYDLRLLLVELRDFYIKIILLMGSQLGMNVRLLLT